MSVQNRDTADESPGPGGVTNDFVRRGALAPLPPKDFQVKREGVGVRLSIVERDKLADRSGTITYVVAAASDVDTTTQVGLDAGAARAEQCGSITAPGTLDTPATQFLTDSRYQTGVFFCWGVDAAGTRSTEYRWSQALSGEILDSTIPGDFTHFDVSESGEELAPGVISSMLTVTARAPTPLGSCAGLQLYYGDYTRLGTTEEGDFRRYTGAAGGTISFKTPLALVRRAGTGTINLTAGSAAVTVTGGTLLSEVQAGDQLEIFGLRVTFNQPTNNTTVTLAVPWSASAPAGAFTGWKIIPFVRVIGVSISKGGTRRTDIENAPFKRVLLDGDISAPVAPTILAATSLGNAIRIDAQQPIGTALDRLHLWKAKGFGILFSQCVEIDSIPINTALAGASSGILQFVDEKFTTYEREQGQAFSYYLTVTNLRGDPSPPSDVANAQCRLDTPGDNGPTQSGGAVAENLLFNSYIYGTAGNTVSTADASQDTYQGAAPAGSYRWGGNSTATLPGHQNNTEALLPAPGAGGFCQLAQRVDGWDHATVANRRVDKGRNLTLSLYLLSTSATPPNGSIKLQIAMQNAAGSDIGYYSPKLRTSTDAFAYTASPGIYQIAGSLLTQYPQIIFCTFSPQTIPAAVDHIEVRVTHSDTNNGNNLIVTKVMLNYGDQWGQWTPKMGTNPFPPPGGVIPPAGSYPDRDGTRRGYVDLVP